MAENEEWENVRTEGGVRGSVGCEGAMRCVCMYPILNVCRCMCLVDLMPGWAGSTNRTVGYLHIELCH